MKYQDYEAQGVREYWIFDPVADILEQYVLSGEKFELRLKAGAGEVASVAIPGMKIPILALLDEDEFFRMHDVLRVVQ